LEDDLDTADGSSSDEKELRLRELVTQAEREARITSERMKLGPGIVLERDCISPAPASIHPTHVLSATPLIG
jgi:hypothetical protein